MEECLRKVFCAFEGTEHELISVLQSVQKELGYLPGEAMCAIADFVGIPESQVYAVATFYAQFRFTPIGRHHVMVCRGTACHVMGAQRILEQVERELGIKDGETSEDLQFSLETVACIGACGLAPNITINHEVYGRLTPKKVSKIMKGIRSESERTPATA